MTNVCIRFGGFDVLDGFALTDQIRFIELHTGTVVCQFAFVKRVLPEEQILFHEHDIVCQFKAGMLHKQLMRKYEKDSFHFLLLQVLLQYLT